MKGPSLKVFNVVLTSLRLSQLHRKKRDELHFLPSPRYVDLFGRFEYGEGFLESQGSQMR